MSAYSSSTQHVLRDKCSLDRGLGGRDGGTAEVQPSGGLFNTAGRACSPSSLGSACQVQMPASLDSGLCVYNARLCVQAGKFIKSEFVIYKFWKGLETHS